MNSLRLKKITFFLPLLIVWISTRAQLPNCGADSVFYFLDQNTGRIFNYSPYQPVSATNPVMNTINPWAIWPSGLAVCNNINGGTPSPTFYIIDALGDYNYWNGTSWVNTGHFSGDGAAVNIAGGGNYIFSLNCWQGEVYRYDGTGTGIWILSLPGYQGPCDLLADCTGNFYVLNTAPGVMKMTKYNPNGVALQNWSITGLPAGTGSAGFAKVGNTFYVDKWLFTNEVYSGTISGTTINFTGPISLASPTQFFDFADFGSCTIGGTNSPLSSMDTVYQCPGSSPVTLSAGGNGPFTWTVVSGPAQLSANTGANITVTSTASSLIQLVTLDTAVCGPSVDTIVLLVPQINVNAGPDDTVVGCGALLDTLNASAVGNIPNLILSFNWTPANAVVSGGNTLTPVVTPNGLTPFVLTVYTAPSQGGCVFTDTVFKNVNSMQPNANFSFDIRYGCSEDTVNFTNATTDFKSLMWYFGDGTVDTTVNPVHIYASQNSYNVKLLAHDKECVDSITLSLDTKHPLSASFTFSDDTICLGTPVSLTNTSTYTTIDGPVKFMWIFGDGSTDSIINSIHNYSSVGEHLVTLIVGDFVPCTDTAFKLIVVDSCKESTVWVPSAFSPNNDGLNDIFKLLVSGNKVKLQNFSIYNRWGEKVFYSVRIDEGWNGMYLGKLCDVGTYFYSIDYVIDHKAYHKKGDVTLVR